MIVIKMLLKTIEYYLILWTLSEVVICVSARAVDSDTKFISDAQFNYLAEEVCSIMKLNDTSVNDTCEEIFKGPDPNSPQHPAPIKLECLTEYSVRYKIEPSRHWQLVTLVPVLGANDTADEFFIQSITYSLVEPRTEYVIVSTTKQNYTMWTTKLINGVPKSWRGGDVVPAYIPAEHKEYDVDIQFYKVEDKMLVNAYFVWNYSRDDRCFDIANRCSSTRIVSDNLWRKDRAQKQFDNLKFDEECDLIVTGIHGTKKLSYSTPGCEFFKSCLQDAETPPEEPEYVKNVTVVAQEDSPDTWRVLVTWEHEGLQPDGYNITVWAKFDYSVLVDGNVTEAVITRVEGTKFYDISIDAIFGNITWRKAVRAYFPARGGGAGAAGGALLAAALCALLCCCRRRDAPDAPHLQEEIPKESEDVVCSVEDAWEVRWERLALHEVVGEGAFGVVRRATFLATGQDVAVKMLKAFPSGEEIRCFRSEMELMKSVGVHPHIVSLVGCCTGNRPFIIAEYCSRGDLLSYLRCTWDIMLSKRNVHKYNNNIDTTAYRNDIFKCNQMENSKLVVNKLYEIQDICDRELTVLDLLSFCRQIAMGMEYLAANRVVHRDLAARNVLVTADRTVKIADFGLSRDVYEENQYKQKGNGKMPIKWMALESLTRRIFTTQSDVWSFGVVVWEIATLGGAPYPGVSAARLPRLLRDGYRMPKPDHCSPQLYEIMWSCWRSSPRARPTFSELHASLDTLLHERAHTYLALHELTPAPSRTHRYFNMFLRHKRSWSRGESYERPLQARANHYNHYTSAPAFPLTHGAAGRLKP